MRSAAAKQGAQALRGAWDEALAAAKEALRLHPDHAGALTNLGAAFMGKGNVNGAIEAFRQAVRLNPNASEYWNLGLALARKGACSDAAAAYREAIRIQPNLQKGQAQVNLWGSEFLNRTGLKPTSFLEKLESTSNTAEQLARARRNHEQQHYRAAARAWYRAFAIQPGLADDVQRRSRLQAARSAALAGCSQGKEAPPLYEQTNRFWRDQALAWLRADLALLSKEIERGKPENRDHVRETLQLWQNDKDLAGLREPAAVAKLPAAEREACKKLWTEADALLQKARGGK